MDIRVEYYGGSVALIRPLTQAGEAWVEANLEVDGWQWYGKAAAVEPRFLNAIADGAVGAGLEVEG